MPHQSPQPSTLGKPTSTGALFANGGFVGLLVTQFLGAFNDNVYKQMVLLLCLDYKRLWSLDTDQFQPIATVLFSVGFLAFSGFAGYLSDKFRKRQIIVISKLAEIVVMLAGLLALWVTNLGSPELLWALVFVLLLMGTQSAFFGPSKYGILPEMLSEKDLPAANGWIQMTTFLAIIFGIAFSGFLKNWVGDQLWVICVVCVGIAVLGTLSSLMIRSRPPARPDLQFSASCLLIESSAWRLLKSDRLLMTVLLVYSIFWFAGGVVLPTVNEIGKSQLGWDDFLTSKVAACMAFGIGIGCAISGYASKNRIAFGLVRLGALGTALAFVAVSAIAGSLIDAAAKPYWVGGGLFVAGAFAGLMAVPLQVFLQARPPADQKGRVIGAMNLFTWIGIFLSPGFYYVCHLLLQRANLPPCWILAALAPIMLGITLAFWPKLDARPAQ